MLKIMTVRCNECGHENNPEYVFCGMCGARLQFPPAATVEPPRGTARPIVSGPSFLGLADESPRSVSYLLEDEPHWGRRVFVALLLLLLLAGFLVWRWKGEGYLWAALQAGRAAVSRALASSRASTSPPAQPDAATPSNESQANAPEAEHSTAAAEKTESAQQPPAPASQAPSTAASPQSPASDSPPQQGANSEAAESAAKQPTESAARPEESSAAETQPAPREKSAARALPISKSSKAKAPPEVPSSSSEDQLAADGERYLYGNGVPRNCGRAQKNLLAAAQHSSAKAESLLGAMYATGHCVPRDVPAAYRWFARALHQDPGNTRIARDLEILWKQMTPEERQIAMRSGQ